jgi:hypothetical protein
MLDGWMNAFSTEMNDVDDSTYMKSTRFMFRLDLRLLSVCACVCAPESLCLFSFSLIFRRRPSARDDRKEDWQEPRDRNWDFGGNWLIWCWVLMPPPPLCCILRQHIRFLEKERKIIKTTFIFLSFSIRRPHFVCPRVFVFERFDRTMRLPAIPVSNM